MWSPRQSTTATSSVLPQYGTTVTHPYLRSWSGAYLWVTDVRRACEEIRVRGGRITREIEETYYGCREFEIEDLNGLLLCFGEELSPEVCPT
jgi:uncharacterized glyoxalase superfamily protein PhnB